MSSSIRVSEETKARLEAVKREGETFDELLNRLAIERTEKDIDDLAGFADDDIDAHMADKRDELNESISSGAE